MTDGGICSDAAGTSSLRPVPTGEAVMARAVNLGPGRVSHLALSAHVAVSGLEGKPELLLAPLITGDGLDGVEPATRSYSPFVQSDVDEVENGPLR